MDPALSIFFMSPEVLLNMVELFFKSLNKDNKLNYYGSPYHHTNRICMKV